MVSGPNLGRFGRRRTTRGGAGVRRFRRHEGHELRRAVLGRFPRVAADLRLRWNGRPHHRSYCTDGQQAVQLVVEEGLAVLGRLRLRGLGRLLLRGLGGRRWGRGLHLVFGWGAAAAPGLREGLGSAGRLGGCSFDAGVRSRGRRRGALCVCDALPPDLDGRLGLVRSGDRSAESRLRLLRLAWFVAGGRGRSVLFVSRGRVWPRAALKTQTAPRRLGGPWRAQSRRLTREFRG